MSIKKSIGIDISDHTIELVEIQKKGKSLEVINLVRDFIPEELINKGNIQDQIRLKDYLKKLFKVNEINFNDAVVSFGLPESQVYTYVLNFQEKSKKDVLAELDETVHQTIPIENTNILYGSEITIESKDNVEVLIVGSNRKLLQGWSSLFTSLKIEITNFDSEILALGRAILNYDEIKKGVLVIDLGATVTNYGIFDNNGVRLTHSLVVGGNDLNKELAKEKGITFIEAEAKKIEVGLGKETKKTFTPVLEQIIISVNQSIEYYESQKGGAVDTIIIAGGSSQLIGLDEYLKEKTGKKVEKAKVEELADEEIDNLEFIEAYGIALKTFIPGKEPVLKLVKSKKRKAKAGQHYSSLKGNENEVDNSKKGKLQVVLFLILLIGGIGALWYAINFRNEQRADRMLKQIEERNVQK